MRYPSYIEAAFDFPPFWHMRTHAAAPRIDDVPAAVAHAVDQALVASPVGSGESVAVAVGSRGLANLPLMVRVLCRQLQKAGARPFIVPAMGSHGGATAEGQAALLARLGVTEDACHAPVHASMEAVPVATVLGEVPVYLARDIIEADHAVCLNRIKPHTKFKGSLESGLAKMLCVGMGKHAGALSFHRWALRHGFHPLLQEMARALLEHSNFRFGVAVVENALDEPCWIEAVPAEKVLAREPALLAMAKKHFPRLPFRELDVLVVETIGKEISGAGMDPNVTGRAFDLMESDFSQDLRATRVAVLNLSERTGGNAIGLGNADIITEKVFRAMDYEATLMNALTSLSLHKAFIPVRLPDDRKALQACFTTLGPTPADAIRAVIIRDTRHVGEFLATAPLGEAIAGRGDIEVIARDALGFDDTGGLIAPWHKAGRRPSGS